MKKSWRKQIELIVLGTTAFISILVSVLDFLGVLGQLTWLNLDIPTLSLLLLGFVALFLAIERRNFQETNQEEIISHLIRLSEAQELGIQTVIESLKGVHLKSFDNEIDCLNYTNRRILEARVSIDDTSWSPAVSRRANLPNTLTANKEFRERTAKISQKIPYREIFVFNRHDRLEKLKRRLLENTVGYFCAYFDNDPEIPLLQFMIVDKEEVILLSDQYPTNLSIRHPKIVQLFQKYFDDLWSRALIIKDSNGIKKDVVDKIVGNAH